MPLVFRRRLRAFVLGAVPSASLQGTCGRPVRGLLPIDGEEVITADEESEDTGLHLTVDWTRCAGHGLCGYLLPAMVRLDENGFPVVAGKPVPSRLLKDAKQAIEMCPALALSFKP